MNEKQKMTESKKIKKEFVLHRRPAQIGNQYSPNSPTAVQSGARGRRASKEGTTLVDTRATSLYPFVRAAAPCGRRRHVSTTYRELSCVLGDLVGVDR